MMHSFESPRIRAVALLHLVQDTLLASTTYGSVEAHAKADALAHIYDAAAALRSAAPAPRNHEIPSL